MDSDRSKQALARIDAALARLEAAALRPSPSTSAIEARHRLLSEAVGDALRQLDALIAEHAR
jgi:hypothetical protein